MLCKSMYWLGLEYLDLSLISMGNELDLNILRCWSVPCCNIKNKTLYRVDISMSDFWNSWQLLWESWSITFLLMQCDISTFHNQLPSIWTIGRRYIYSIQRFVFLECGHGVFNTSCADNTVVRGFGMGDRCSFFHMTLIELILRNTFAAAKRAAKGELPNLHITIQPAFLVIPCSNLEHVHRNTWKILTRKVVSFDMSWPSKSMLAICNL